MQSNAHDTRFVGQIYAKKQ